MLFYTNILSSIDQIPLASGLFKIAGTVWLIKFSISNLIRKEEEWLQKQDYKKKFILQLKKLGWNISFEEWTEFIYQKVDSSTIKRWLNEGSEYREIILKNCKEETLDRLHKLFKRLEGQTIKQKLLHTKYIAKRIIN